jgi:hypothetical protein
VVVRRLVSGFGGVPFFFEDKGVSEWASEQVAGAASAPHKL